MVTVEFIRILETAIGAGVAVWWLDPNNQAHRLQRIDRSEQFGPSAIFAFGFTGLNNTSDDAFLIRCDKAVSTAPSKEELWKRAFTSFRRATDALSTEDLPGGGHDRCLRIWDDFEAIINHLEQS